MGLATNLAQRQTKTGEFSPTYTLTLDGKNVDAALYDCSVTYSSDGTSDLSISADTDLERYQGTKAVLEVGYGSEQWAYFGGWLEEAENDNWGGPSTGNAYGPFKEMAEHSIAEDVTYAAQQLGTAIVDLHQRAGTLGSTYEIIGNPSYLLEGEEAGLSIGTTLADGVGTLLELANWRGHDRPGFRRRYRTVPRPRPSAEPDARYTEAHFPPGGFRAVRGKPYGAVGAYARDEEGALKWDPVIVTVDPTVSSSKIYWLEDFAGDDADALLECGRLASMLRAGVFTWSLEGISANPELELYSTVRVHTTELRDEGGRHKERYSVIYDCAIDTSAQIDVSREGHPMNLAGETAIRVSSRKIAKAFADFRPRSSVVRAA